MNEKEDGL